MEIHNIFINPNRGSLEPELEITVNFSFKNESKVPVKFVCFLKQGGTVLAHMNEYSARGGNFNSLASSRSVQGKEWKDSKVFLAPLSKIALNNVFITSEPRLIL